MTDATLLAACLCYSDKVWQPDSYDSPWTSCAYYLSTADPAAYSTFVENSDHHVQTAPCRDLGDILGSTTPATPGPTPSIGPIQSNSVSSFSNTASQTSDTGRLPPNSSSSTSTPDSSLSASEPFRNRFLVSAKSQLLISHRYTAHSNYNPRSPPPQLLSGIRNHNSVGYFSNNSI